MSPYEFPVFNEPVTTEKDSASEKKSQGEPILDRTYFRYSMETLSKEVLFKLRPKEWKRRQLHTGRIHLRFCVLSNKSQYILK